jgi:hypothetical protein
LQLLSVVFSPNFVVFSCLAVFSIVVIISCNTILCKVRNGWMKMNEWRDGWMDEWMALYECKDGWINCVWMNDWRGGWMKCIGMNESRDGWVKCVGMNEWIIGGMDE